jgi:hypothetical protein
VDKLWRQTETMNLLLDDARFIESDYTAERVRTAALEVNAQIALLLSASPSLFNPEWLRGINASLPADVWLNEIKIQDSHITLVSITDELTGTETHRMALTDTNLFDWVRFGGFSKRDDGSIRYELHMQTK